MIQICPLFAHRFPNDFVLQLVITNKFHFVSIVILGVTYLNWFSTEATTGYSVIIFLWNTNHTLLNELPLLKKQALR